MGLLDDRVNVRKSSFSAPLWQRLRILGWEAMGSGGWAAEPYTCQMICHYGGGQYSAVTPLITHPTPQINPPSLPNLSSSPPKTPPAFLRRLQLHSQRRYPICPSFLRSALGENVPL